MNSFVPEASFYLVFAGMDQFCAAVLAAPLIVPLMVRIRRITYPRALAVYGVFNLVLLIWGCLGNYIFMSLAYEKMYVSVDTFVDWYPFIPFGQWVLDQGFGGDSHGRLLGNATLGELRLLWLALAAPVWLLTWISTSVCLRLLRPAYQVGFQIKADARRLKTPV